MLVGCKLDVAVASKRFQHLDLNQRHLTINVVVLGVGTEPGRVTVAFQPDTGDQAHLGERDHRRRRFRRDVDVQQLSLPVHAVIIALVDSPHNAAVQFRLLLVRALD